MLTEEHLMIRDAVREFAVAELGATAPSIDHEARFPRAAWPKLAGLDLLGLAVPAEAGGAGAGDTAFVLSVLELGRVCGSTAAALAVHATLGALPIAAAGSEAQRRRWLAPLLAGQRFATMVVADATPDAPPIVAVPDAAGWTLDGVCNAVPGAGNADTLVVPARYEGGIDFGLFVVDAATPGVAQIAAPAGLGLRGLGHGRVELRAVAVTADVLLGDADAARIVVASAQEAAWLGIAAVAAGIAQGAFERALRYGRERPQFDRPIIDHESVQWLLADAALDTHTARLAAMKAARAREAGTPARREAAMAKIIASEAAVRVGDRAIQVHGGYGYITEFHVERCYRDAQVCALVCGSNDDLRRLVVRDLAREADAGWTLLQ